MKDYDVKKQLEANLVPNFWRILRTKNKAKTTKKTLVWTSDLLVRTVVLTAALIALVKVILGLPKTPVPMLILAAAAAYLSSRIIVSLYGKSTEERDDEGNIIDSSNVYGASRKMSQEKKRRYLATSCENDPVGTILGKDKETGMILGIPDEDREFMSQLPFRSILLYGAPGTGKTNFIKARMLQAFKKGLSQLYFDPKGELTVEAAKHAWAHDYELFGCIRLREDDIELSSGIDILKPIRKAKHPDTTAGDIAEKLLGYRNTSKDDNYWDNAIRSLLVGIELGVSICDGFIPIKAALSGVENVVADREHGTFVDIIDIVSCTADEVDEWLCYMMRYSKRNEDILIRHYNSWRGDERNWRGHVSSLQKKLGIFAERGVAEIFSRDEIDLDDAVTKKAFLSIIFDLPNKHFKPALTLIYELYMLSINRNATKRGDTKTPLRNVVIMEELSGAGLLEALDVELSVIRSFGTQLIICAQSYPQLVDIYGENKADSFFQNANLVYTGGAEYRTRKKIEEMTGMQGVLRETNTVTYGGGSFRSTEGEQSISKNIYTADKLLDMEPNEIFFSLLRAGSSIEYAYPADKHPLAAERFVDAATGRPQEVTLEDLVPGFDPKEKGLKIIGKLSSSATKTQAREQDYEDFLFTHEGE